MTDIIERIYHDISMDNNLYSKECRELYGRADTLWNSVLPLLGKETVEKLQEVYLDLEVQTTLEWFREGVRTGLSLAQELS